ncbi:TetR/AcrR family transcriptional regulator [Salinifilum ghardaiensis]
MEYGTGQNPAPQQPHEDARTVAPAQHGDEEAGSVWLRSRQVTPRQTAPLSRERIAAEAVDLLDSDGTQRLTMRRLADRLGTGATTLYWHVDTKDDVLDLALDEIFGEVPLPAPPTNDSWHAPLNAFLHQWRTVLLQHPWSAPLLGTRPLMGPNALARSEFLHATLLTAGIPQPHLTAAAYALSNYVIGSVATRAAWHVRGNESAVRHAAQNHLQIHHASYPVQAEYLIMTDQDWDASFTHGLAYLLDGLHTHTENPHRGDQAD